MAVMDLDGFSHMTVYRGRLRFPAVVLWGIQPATESALGKVASPLSFSSLSLFFGPPFLVACVVLLILAICFPATPISALPVQNPAGCFLLGQMVLGLTASRSGDYRRHGWCGLPPCTLLDVPVLA